MNRRDFAKTAAVLGCTLARAPRMPGAAAGMYISMNGSLTGGKPAWPDFARLAARTGFGGVDVNLGAATKEGLEATRALFAEIKIRASNTNLPVQFSRDDPTFQTGIKTLDDAAAFSAAIGCPTMLGILPPASQTPKAELHKILKDRLAAIAEILQRSRVRLALEFLGPLHFRTAQPHEFIWRMDEALEFAKECGPNVGLLLDVWHWYHAGATVSDIAAAGRARIFHVHLSDCVKEPPEQVRDNQRVLPGEGVINLTGFLQALQNIGYQDGISPEPIGRIPKEMAPEEGARLGLAATLAVIRKAGVAA
jgi:sugar phosphate isomerase/epimerase